MRANMSHNFRMDEKKAGCWRSNPLIALRRLKLVKFQPPKESEAKI